MGYWIQYPDLQIDEVAHVYTWKGSRARGVTSVFSDVATRKILPDGNTAWEPVGFDERFVSAAVTQAAIDFGHTFHKIGAIILRGGVPGYPAPMEPWVRQFRRFLVDWQIHPLWDDRGNPIVEYPLYSERMRIAGTPDLLALFGRKRSVGLFDWKTSTSNQDHWRAQTAAYAEMSKEVLKIKQKIVHIPVRFTETGYTPDIRDNHPEDFIWFRSLHNVLKAAA